jgi:hypothetical protein
VAKRRKAVGDRAREAMGGKRPYKLQIASKKARIRANLKVVCGQDS